MTANRAGWFEAFQNFVQFYPKLSATIAFSTMAAAGRMIPTSRPTTIDSVIEKPVRQVTTSARIPATKRVTNARKKSKLAPRKMAKRMSSRRKAA